MGEGCGRRRLNGIALNDDEFVAAGPDDQVRVPSAFAQALRHRAQYRVACGMAKCVIDRFEAVKIEAKHRDTTVSLGVSEDLAHMLMETTRFANPVSWSCRAMWVSLASAARRSVVSS